MANNVSRDISGLDTQSGTVTFRLGLADTGSNASNKLSFIGDLNLNGTVSEPTTLGIATVGLAALLTARRRTRA